MNRRIFRSFMGTIIFALITVTAVFLVTMRFQSGDILKKQVNDIIKSYVNLSDDGELKDATEKFMMEDRRLILFNGSGDITAVSPGTTPEDTETVLQKSGSFSWKNSEGRLYSGSCTLTPGGSKLCALAYRDNTSDTFGSYRQYILASLTVLILISAFIALRLSSFLMEPINDLITATGQIAAGELSSRVRIYRNAELGILAENFNEMADRLENTITDSFEKQNQLEAILTSMNSGVIACDRYGKIIIFNNFAKKLFGVSGDVIGKSIGDVLKGTDLQELMTVRRDFSEMELGISEPRTIRYKTTDLTGEARYGTGKVTVLSDVTDIKKLESMRTQFVANVSHELKTPLTSIKGFSETLRDVHDEKTKNKFLDIIDAESERLRRLIDDILSLSAIENPRETIREVVDAEQVTVDTCSLVELQAREKNVEFALIVRGHPKFIGDIDKYKQLVINLVDNAIKYTESGGKVKVRLEERKEDLTLTVSDTGLGIGEEHIPRLFERFYRVDKSRDRQKGGTGLGLAIVKHIVIGFGGSIDVQSEVGRGTTFTVVIPVYRETDSEQSGRIRSVRFTE